jgi:L-ascorbate metabolism protein UlaG (beta-lactamase superfamily)
MTPGFLLHWLTRKAKGDLRFVRQMLADCLRTVPAAPQSFAPSEWSDAETYIAWLGHACVLIKMHGVTILTDPALGLRVGPNLGPLIFGPKRYVKPALTVADLPPLDLVLVSHAHFDHLDHYTLRRLPPTKAIVTAKHTRDLFAGVRAERLIELEWGRPLDLSFEKGGVSVTAFPVNHPTSRWRHDTHRTGNAYYLASRGMELVFIGDTAYDEKFADALPASAWPDALVIPIGCYNPYIWNHCTPQQALEIARMLRARMVIPTHHSTFRLSREPLDEPLRQFVDAPAGPDIIKTPLQVGEYCRIPRRNTKGVAAANDN